MVRVNRFRYPFRVEVKHGSMMIRPMRIVVTSNYSIEELWPSPEVFIYCYKFFPLTFRFIFP